MFTRSSFLKGLEQEEFSFLMGINESVSDKMLIKPHSRYVLPSVNEADGVSWRRNSVSSDGFGFARAPYDNTAFVNGFGRGLGIFPFLSSSTPESLFTSFVGVDRGNEIISKQRWKTNKLNPQSLMAQTSPSSVTSLPTHTALNGYDVLADYLTFTKQNDTSVFDKVLQQPQPLVVTQAPVGFNYATQWGNITNVNGVLRTPEGLTYFNDQVYVCNSGNDYIQVFDKDGNFVFKWGGTGTAAGQFDTPIGICGVNIPAGKFVYVVDQGNNRVQIFTPNGGISSSFGTAGSGQGQFNAPTDIASDANGNVYVTDTGNNRVQAFDYLGNFIGEFGTPGAGNGEFDTPIGIATDASSAIFVVDSGNFRVQKFDMATFAFVLAWGSNGTGTGQFSNPKGITAGYNGEPGNFIPAVLVADQDAGGSRVQRFDIDGTFVDYTFVTGNNAWGVTISPDGSIYCDDTSLNQVNVFTFKFKPVQSVSGIFSADAVVRAGVYYDLQGNEVRKYDSALNFILSWNFFNNPTITAALQAQSQFFGHGDLICDGFGLAIDNANAIYVTVYVRDTGTLSGLGSAVLKFDSFGSFIQTFVYDFNDHTLGVQHVTGISVDDANDQVYVSDCQNHRIVVFNRSGVHQFNFGTAGTGNGEFNTPWGSMVDGSTNVYIVDDGNNRVQVFDKTGTYQSQFPLGQTGSPSSAPRYIKQDVTGNFYVSNSGYNNVQTFSSAGVVVDENNNGIKKPYGIAVDTANRNIFIGNFVKPIQTMKYTPHDLFNFGSSVFGPGQFNIPTWCDIDLLGQLFVSDTANRRVQKFDGSGNFILQFTVSNPRGIAVDLSGNVFVVNDNQVTKYDSIGNIIFSFGTIGTAAGQFVNPRGIVIDLNGNICVVDTGNNRVQKFDATGTFLLQFGTGGTGNGEFNGPQGISIDSGNNLYVTDTVNDRVQKFDSAGAYITQWGSTGTGDGEFSGPIGIDISSNDDVMVVDTGNDRFQQFSTAGVFVAKDGSTGSGNGQFMGPEGIAFQQSAYFYIVDTGNNRVQKFAMPPSNLTGYYAWCWTLVDIFGNESLPSPLASAPIFTTSFYASLAFAFTGIDLTKNQWTKVRFYRTLTQNTPVLAAENPVFFHVPGIDFQITSPLPTTVVIDNVADSDMEAVTNFRLTNVAYFNGALEALDVTSVPKYIASFDNRIFGANWKTATNEFPLRIYWCDLTDNSQTSTGNITSWNSDNFIDIGTPADGEIIGMRPGLQGRLYIFKERGTYVISPTGNPIEPYTSIPISHEYGFFHHSVAEIPGALIGRTKDGIATFNGSSFKHISHNIRVTLARCTTPQWDSGIYDYTNLRYYLSLYDPALSVSSLTLFHGREDLMNAYRNMVICFDFNNGEFEFVKRTPIQVFGKLFDVQGREKIVGLGMSSDIYYVMPEGDICGPSISGMANPTTATTLNLGNIGQSSGFGGFNNRDIYLTWLDNLNGNGLNFLTYRSTVTNTQFSGGNCIVTVAEALPEFGSTAVVMYHVDNALGLGSIPVAQDELQDVSNLFQKSTIQNFSIMNNVSGDSMVTPLDTGIFVKDTHTLNNFNFTGFSSGLPTAYVLIPYRWESAGADPVPRRIFKTPPFGTRIRDEVKKSFHYFRFQVRGSGLITVKHFLNGSTTVYKTYTIPIASKTEFTQEMIFLDGVVGNYSMFEVSQVRGAGRFEIIDFRCYYRFQEELSHV